MPRLNKDSIARLGQFLVDCQTPLALLPKIGIVVGGIAEFAGLHPPVGHKPTALIVAAIGLIFIAGLCFAFWTGNAIGRTRCIAFYSICAFVVAVAVYLLIKDNLVVVFEDDPEHAHIIGFILKDPQLAELRRRDPTRYTNEFMLDGSDRKPEKVWTDGSLATTRLLFFISWVSLWLAPIAFLAAILAVQARRKATKKGRNNGTK